MLSPEKEMKMGRRPYSSPQLVSDENLTPRGKKMSPGMKK